MLRFVLRRATWLIVAALIALSIAQGRPMPNETLLDP